MTAKQLIEAEEYFSYGPSGGQHVYHVIDDTAPLMYNWLPALQPFIDKAEASGDKYKIENADGSALIKTSMAPDEFRETMDGFTEFVRVNTSLLPDPGLEDGEKHFDALCPAHMVPPIADGYRYDYDQHHQNFPKTWHYDGSRNRVYPSRTRLLAKSSGLR